MIDAFDFLTDPDMLVPGKVDAFVNHIYNITSVPQSGINGQTSAVLAGAVIGGGSAVNGMFFDRGSVADYDAWEALGSQGWGWKDLFPYFKKVTCYKMSQMGMLKPTLECVLYATINRRS